MPFIEFAELGKKILLINFWLNIGLAVFYFLFLACLPPDHPLINFLSLIPIKSPEQIKGEVVAGKFMTALGLANADPVAAVQVASNIANVFLCGVGTIFMKLIQMIPNYGPLVATALHPVFIVMGFASYMYFFVCIVFKRC